MCVAVFFASEHGHGTREPSISCADTPGSTYIYFDGSPLTPLPASTRRNSSQPRSRAWVGPVTG